MNSNRILAIDYGTKRIGISLSDPLRILAQPLPTIKVTNIKQVLGEIGNLISEKGVAEIVIGKPLHLKGTKGDTAEKVDAFIEKLKEKFRLPVHDWDERWTSLAAERTIRELGKKPFKHKEKIDQIAAQLILQSFLDHLSLKQQT